jgi:hypothetical protein
MSLWDGSLLDGSLDRFPNPGWGHGAEFESGFDLGNYGWGGSGNYPEAIPSKKKEALGISRVFHFKMDGTARIELAGFTPLTAHRVDNHHPGNSHDSPLRERRVGTSPNQNQAMAMAVTGER